MPYFPVDKPFLMAGYAEDKPDNRIWANPKTRIGPVRRRFTAVPEIIGGSMRVSAQQMQTVLDFFDHTLADGSLEFDWVHPRTGAACTMWLGSRPKPVPVSGGVLWDLQLELIIRP